MGWIPSYKKPGGDSYTPPTWADGTDDEIVTALEKHYAGEIDLTEYWSVGDERIISLSAMTDQTYANETHAAQDITMVLTEVGGKYLADGTTTCAFQVDQKSILFTSTGVAELGSVQSSSINGGWNACDRRNWCNNTYRNAFPSSIQPIFKQFINQSGNGTNTKTPIVNSTDYFALRAEIEIFGTITNSVSGEGSHVEWYKTTANRKKPNDYNWKGYYWGRSNYSGNSIYSNCFYVYAANANKGFAGGSTNYGISPFGVI